MANNIQLKLTSAAEAESALISLSRGAPRAWSLVKSGDWFTDKAGTWAALVAPEEGIKLEVGSKPIGSLRSLHPALAKIGEKGDGGVQSTQFKWEVVQIG